MRQPNSATSSFNCPWMSRHSRMRLKERKWSRHASWSLWLDFLCASASSKKFQSLIQERKSDFSSSKRFCASSAAAARSLGLWRGSCTESPAAMTSTSRSAFSDFAQLVAFVHGAQLGEQRVPVLDRLGRRRVDEGKLLDPAQAERFHSQDDVGKRGAQHFRIRERRARLEFLLRVEADADPARDPAAAACALLRRGLGNAFHAQLLDLIAVAVALDAGETGVDDITDSRDGERRLRDVGREHDAPAGVRLEYALLLLGREPREQGQDLSMRRVVFAQGLRRLPDLALAREEHEDVALPLARQFVRRIADRFVEIVVFVLRLDRVVTDLHRVEPPGNLDDGSAVEVLREPLGIDGRRGDDELEVRPLIFLTLEELLEVAEQEVDVEAALVRLVDDERVVSAELAVPLGLGQQDAVGHDLDVGAWAHFVGEADLVADRASKLGLQLPGDARSGGARCDPARLGMPYESLDPSAQIEADLGQLRALARAGFTAHDDDLMRGDGLRDLLAPRADRQLGRKLGTRHERATLLDFGRGKCHQECGRGAVATRLFATEQALGVACERVHFQVDAVTRPETPERGHGERVRNQVDLEFGAAHRVHRQAHAVHRDRALARDVAREPARRAYPKKAIRPRLPQPRDLADPVHMPRDKMAAEPVGHPQRLLEVDFARLVEPHGTPQGLTGHVYAEALPRTRDHGEAYAVHRDAVADGDIAKRQRTGVHREAQASLAPFRFPDPPRRGDDSAEHFAPSDTRQDAQVRADAFDLADLQCACLRQLGDLWQMEHSPPRIADHARREVDEELVHHARL